MSANLLLFVSAIPRRHRKRLLLEFCAEQDITVRGVKNPTELELAARILAGDLDGMAFGMFVEACAQDEAEGRL